MSNPPFCRDIKVEKAARALWHYHCIYDPLEQADAIIGLGSYDLRVADRCAELFFEELAPIVLFTGSAGNWTRGRFSRSEAEVFAERVIAQGVPESAIMLEQHATNIGENIRFSAKMLAPERRVILVTKPQTQRRCLATAKKQWPDGQTMTTAPMHSFAQQPTQDFPLDHLIHEMVGDFHRMQTYPNAGYQVAQDMPANAIAAYKFLVSQGFTGHVPST